MTKLFRPEAIQHATRRLGGDVVLISPLSVWLLGGLLFTVLIGGVFFAAGATENAGVILQNSSGVVFALWSGLMLSPVKLFDFAGGEGEARGIIWPCSSCCSC